MSVDRYFVFGLTGIARKLNFGHWGGSTGREPDGRGELLADSPKPQSVTDENGSDRFRAGTSERMRRTNSNEARSLTSSSYMTSLDDCNVAGCCGGSSLQMPMSHAAMASRSGEQFAFCEISVTLKPARFVASNR